MLAQSQKFKLHISPFHGTGLFLNAREYEMKETSRMKWGNMLIMLKIGPIDVRVTSTDVYVTVLCHLFLRDILEIISLIFH